MSTADPQAIQALLEAELHSLERSDVVQYIRNLLVPPVEVVRAWNYGAPDEAHASWTVLEHPDSNTGIAYCDAGFGPRSPWGLVFLSGDATRMSLGMDSAWFTTFLQAFFDSMAATDLAIWRVYRTDPSGHCQAITAEQEWSVSWAMIEDLRKTDPANQFHCEHDIAIERE